MPAELSRQFRTHPAHDTGSNGATGALQVTLCFPTTKTSAQKSTCSTTFPFLSVPGRSTLGTAAEPPRDGSAQSRALLPADLGAAQCILPAAGRLAHLFGAVLALHLRSLRGGSRSAWPPGLRDRSSQSRAPPALRHLSPVFLPRPGGPISLPQPMRPPGRGGPTAPLTRPSRGGRAARSARLAAQPAPPRRWASGRGREPQNGAPYLAAKPRVPAGARSRLSAAPPAASCSPPPHPPARRGSLWT